jgi:hypothetical protein
VRAQGWSPERLAELKAKMSPATFFPGMLISYFVLALILDLMILSQPEHTIHYGMHAGMLLWVAVAAITFTHQIASGRTIVAYLVDASCELVYLIAMGAILGAWS